ncbi:MAG: alpha/beta fold hydrolase [Solirubrobacterales bacterium]|nr:alpha/beta fold hydrolase [Solirubrobacterales bacterium]MCB8914838.1 alpha/beta fold hydrolase [Thermoleophilales bacterium]
MSTEAPDNDGLLTETLPPAPVHDDYGVSDGRWLEIDWSERIREITVRSALGETPVSYVDQGEGPPILLVHGLGGSWRNWLENIPFLADNHRVVALDLPGFGLSPMPDGEISMPSYGDFILGFADAVGLGPETYLIGHSMGGFISTEAVTSRPERFSRLSLVSAAGISFATISGTRKSLTAVIVKGMIPVAASRAERNMHRKRLRTASFAGVIAHPSMIGNEILWELGTYAALHSPALFAAAFALGGYDNRGSLDRIEIPTQVLWGQQDRLVPVGAAYSYSRRIKHAELSLVDDCGHMVQLERPARFNGEISRFASEAP